MTMKKLIFVLMFVGLITGSIQSLYVTDAVSAETAESWKIEFDKICGQTDTAADMTAAELKKALEKCDALKPQLEALESTPRKVYLKRLQMCRNLFNYLLEGKEKK